MNQQSSTFRDKKVLVMGLGRFGGGVGVSRWLAQQGAYVIVTDKEPAEKLTESIEKLNDVADRITWKLGGHDVADFCSCDLLIANPAVDKQRSEFIQAAIAARVPITTEMNLFLERCPAFTIGITGSVGKSTTTMLIFEALQAGLNGSGSSVYLGGNIGRSLLADLPAMKNSDIVVLELSSFMLEDTPQIAWSPQIAVVTNLFPNHLDRHHTMAEYAAQKQNILKFQKPNDLAVINNDHDLVSRWTHLAKGRVVKYTTRGPASGHVNLLMPGEHNQSNALAALAVLAHLPFTVNRPEAIRAMETYGGLPHRLQIVHAQQFGSRMVRFYNDSKATSPDASITAIRAFAPGTAVLFAGGYDKHIDLSAYENELALHAAGVIGLGATGQPIVENVRKAAPVFAAERIVFADTLEAGLPLAKQWAAEDDKITAIVLSPASASWGQFANYEVRGDRFAALSKSTAE